MTAIEFENISKQYRLGLVSTGTLSHDLNRFWQTKVLRREDPYLKVGEVNDRAHKGASEYVWALKDINLQKPLSLGHGQTSLAAALAHRVFKVEQGDVVGIIGRNGAGKSTFLKLLSRVTAPTTGRTALGNFVALVRMVLEGDTIHARGRAIAVQNRRITRRFSRSEGRAQLTSGPPIAPKPNAALKLV